MTKALPSPTPILILAAALITPTTVAFATPQADEARADIQKTFGVVPGFIKLVPELSLPGALQLLHRSAVRVVRTSPVNAQLP